MDKTTTDAYGESYDAASSAWTAAVADHKSEEEIAKLKATLNDSREAWVEQRVIEDKRSVEHKEYQEAYDSWHSALRDGTGYEERSRLREVLNSKIGALLSFKARRLE